MTLDDAPMDGLDLAIRREAASLRNHVMPTAYTDDAWDDFLMEREAPLLELRRNHTQHRRRIAIAVGLVAALIVAAVIVRTIVDRDSTRLPVISPAPTTAPAPSTHGDYAAVELGTDQKLVAVRNDGTRTVIGTIPHHVVAAVRASNWKGWLGPMFSSIEVSAKGWVAVTGRLSGGFWFFDLHHPDDPGRFVAIPEPSGGDDSHGAWNPDGTLFAAVARGRYAVIVDPTTFEQSQLTSSQPPLGPAVTWTADGSGILTGQPAELCATTNPALTIVPLDGGAESQSIPRLAGGQPHLAEGGKKLNPEPCPPTTAQWPVAQVTVSSGSERTVWVSADDVRSTVLQFYACAFASKSDSLWVVGIDSTDPRRAVLYDVQSPHLVRAASTIELPAGSYQTIFAARSVDVAPDDSAVVVGLDLAPGTAYTVLAYRLVPTDGSEPTELRAQFVGFTPTTLVDELSS
jgi:hypothetical protein